MKSKLDPGFASTVHTIVDRDRSLGFAGDGARCGARR